MQITQQKTILVATLNWGLGHATRCIPLINELIHQNCNVLIASSGKSLELLQIEFPTHSFITLPGYNLHFSKSLSINTSVLLQGLRISRGIKKEHQAITPIISKWNVSGIISDNCYGVYSNSIPSVLLTHQIQLAPSTPLKHFGDKVLKKQFSHFKELWVPDEIDSPISGILSKESGTTTQKNIGILSRFVPNASVSINREEFILITTSGTEPHRSEFETLVIDRFGEKEVSIVLLTGTPKNTEEKTYPSNFTVYSHLAASEFEKLLYSCKLLISRCGYSSIMDAIQTQTPVLFIPTKGQSEQEYLAKRLKATFSISVISEEQLGMEQLSNAKPIIVPMKNSLRAHLGNWISEL